MYYPINVCAIQALLEDSVKMVGLVHVSLILCYSIFPHAVVDVCGQLNMCYSKGTCVDDGIGGYQCICQDGYTTPNCDCASSPCQNLGDCVNRVNGFVCFCVGGLCSETDFEESNTRTDTAEILSGMYTFGVPVCFKSLSCTPLYV